MPKSSSCLLCFRQGVLTSRAPAARGVGTTVAVKDLFSSLPVRHKVPMCVYICIYVYIYVCVCVCARARARAQ